MLVARLRTSDRDAAQGSTEVLAARATSSPKPNTCAKAPTHASSSPTCPTAAPTYAPSTKTTTARVARWKTGSKNNNSIPSPTAPALTTFSSDQLRLWFSTAAYTLINPLRRVLIHFAGACPYQPLFQKVWQRLQHCPLRR